jgi:hypothetical protein
MHVHDLEITYTCHFKGINEQRQTKITSNVSYEDAAGRETVEQGTDSERVSKELTKSYCKSSLENNFSLLLRTAVMNWIPARFLCVLFGIL